MNKVNFISCVHWIKRGVTKEIPNKIEHNEHEIQRLIEEAKQNIEPSIIDDDMNIDDGDGDDDDDDDGDGETNDIMQRYNLNDYDDNDDADLEFGIASLTHYAANTDDPYLDANDSEDSEERDDINIKPDDNLILVGHVNNDAPLLEVYVYNHDNGDLYIHHDVILSSYPLCFEWFNYNSNSIAEHVNYVAIGDMSKDISIWDIDLMNAFEPIIKLNGHKDSVLDLSWNSLNPNTIGSASADHSVVIWDLNTCEINIHLKKFKSNVQSLKYHPNDAHSLLIGDCNGIVSLMDSRSGDIKRWHLKNCEIEKVLWNYHDPYSFLTSTSDGSFHCFDSRNNEKYIYKVKAHNDSITGLCLSPSCRGCLITASTDNCVKIWDFGDTNAKLIKELPNLDIGSILGMSVNPDLPFVMAFGGDKKGNNLKILDISASKDVQSQFMSRLTQNTNLPHDSGQSSS